MFSYIPQLFHMWKIDSTDIFITTVDTMEEEGFCRSVIRPKNIIVAVVCALLYLKVSLKHPMVIREELSMSAHVVQTYKPQKVKVKNNYF